MLSRGQQLLEDGRFKEALACFEGDDVRSVFGRAVALHMLGRFDEAQAEYEDVLAVDPNHQETLSNLVAMNVERFHLELVERYSRRLLAIVPKSQIALQGLIVVAVERRDMDLAASCFARIEPSRPHAGDAVEYRLTRQMVERLKDHHASAAHPY